MRNNTRKEQIEMEVNSINIVPSSVPDFSNIRVSNAEETSQSIKGTSAQKVDSMNILMDLKEMQHFLFMLIGVENIDQASQDNKGNNLNKYA